MTNDKRTFIKINGLPSGFKNTRRWKLKTPEEETPDVEARLTSMHGPNYDTHFSNINCSKFLRGL